VDYVKGKNPLEVRTAALRHIEGSKFTPDYYGDVITWRWVIFPWNYVEDMVNLVPKACEDGSSPEEIKKSMREKFSIDIPEEQIEKALAEIKRRESMK
jgi:hypoxanthine phosphoribosyltransferase